MVVGALRARASCCSTAFVFWERHTDHPILDVHVLHQPAVHRRVDRGHARVLRDVRLAVLRQPVPAVRARLQRAASRASGLLPVAVVADGRGAAERQARRPVRHEDRGHARAAPRGRRAAGLLARHGRQRLRRWSRSVLVHHRRRHGPRHGARDGLDHGLAAAREGRRRLGDERHDPRDRRRARRRHHGQHRHRRRTPRASTSNPSSRRCRRRRRPPATRSRSSVGSAADRGEKLPGVARGRRHRPPRTLRSSTRLDRA